VTCRYCGTDLPEGAMFCGECGRSVAVRPTVSAPLVEIVLDDDPPASREQLGSINDLFAASAPVQERADDVPVASEADPDPDPDPDLDPDPAVDPHIEQPTDDLVDLEQTRLSGPNQAGERFVLQFSTGESVTVFGTGIIGRNPVPEPSEYFDQRVTIFDPTKSVSKTHLEFGQTAGAFWINDRYSGNGTGVRQPESHRVSCEPGKRYLVARGSRVDIGEQFFIVS